MPLGVDSKSIDVLFYFKSHPENNLFYKFKKFNSNWEITVDYGYVRKSVVDIKNGYIYLLFEGGDGTYDIYTTLFVDRKKQHYLIKSKYCPFYPSEIKFFKGEKGKLKKINSMFPKVNPQVFFSRSYRSEILNEILKRNFGKNFDQFFTEKLKYELPRFGTDVKVVLSKTNLLKNPEVNSLKNLNPSEFQKMMRHLKNNTLHLLWNSNTSRFSYGKILKY